MRKAVLVLGIILLFAGVILAAVSLQKEEKTRNRLIKSETKLPLQEEVKWGKWQASAQFNKSEKMLVDFSPPTGETLPDGEATFYINITDPQGGTTTFNLTLVKGVFSPTLQLYLQSNDGGLTVENQPHQIGGTTKYEGQYTVDVYSWKGIIVNYYYPPNGTLGYIDLYEVIVERNYPNLIALPIGIAPIVIGAFLLVWGTRSKKRISKLRENRVQK